MFGSQALETAIGLVTMFFIISLAASQIVEVWSRWVNKRAKTLEGALSAMLDGQETDQAKHVLASFESTSIYESLVAAASRSPLRRRFKGPSYLSAKAFADAVTEMLAARPDLGKDLASLPSPLQKRLTAIVRETRDDLTGIKAGLESWFDETMSRLEGSYKRWATARLVLVGLVIAIGANASTFETAKRLWQEPATRQAVATAASGLAQSDKPQGKDLSSVAKATHDLTELSLPIGWDATTKTQWRKDWWRPDEWSRYQWGTVAGWVLTALLVMLGAPFWFDLLTRLVSLRSTGTKPPTAQDDPASATSHIAKRGATVATSSEAVDVQAALRSALGLDPTPSAPAAETPT